MYYQTKHTLIFPARASFGLLLLSSESHRRFFDKPFVFLASVSHLSLSLGLILGSSRARSWLNGFLSFAKRHSITRIRFVNELINEMIRIRSGEILHLCLISNWYTLTTLVIFFSDTNDCIWVSLQKKHVIGSKYINIIERNIFLDIWQNIFCAKSHLIIVWIMIYNKECILLYNICIHVCVCV